MVFGIPLTLATLAVGLAGIVLSVVQWREWPLQVMSGLLVSLLLVFLMADEWKVVSGPLARGWYIAATLGVVSLCVRWFAEAVERHYRRACQQLIRQRRIDRDKETGIEEKTVLRFV